MKLCRKGMEKSDGTAGAGCPGASLESVLTGALRQELGSEINM